MLILAIAVTLDGAGAQNCEQNLIHLDTSSMKLLTVSNFYFR